MTGVGDEPGSGPEPSTFRKRFGSKARDPASVADAMHETDVSARGRWPWFWDYEVLDWVFYGPLAALAGFAISLAQHDNGFATLIPALWFGWCVVLAPVLVWGVLMRQEPGDVLVTVAALAIGAAPGVVFLPGLWASETPQVMVTFPLLVAWGAASHFLALNQGLVARRAAARGILLIGAGLFCAVAAAGLFAAIAAGWLTGFWAMVCGGLALGLGFVCLKLWLAAACSPND